MENYGFNLVAKIVSYHLLLTALALQRETTRLSSKYGHFWFQENKMATAKLQTPGFKTSPQEVHRALKPIWRSGQTGGFTISTSITWCYAAQKDFFPFTYVSKETSVILWIFFFWSTRPFFIQSLSLTKKPPPYISAESHTVRAPC